MASRRTLLSLTLAASSCWAASSLGLVTADGEFKLNQSNVRGNATLIEDSLVETLLTPVRLKLPGGATMRLDAGSRARIHADRITVERGSGEWSAPAQLEVLTLRVSPESVGRGRFALSSEKAVQLSASQGQFRVMNAQGVLISRLEPGVALAFEPQAADGPTAPSSFIGCVLNKDSKWVLYEPVLKLIVELRGQTALVEREWGNRVQANGTSPTSGQPEGTHVMTVTTITRIETGGCDDMAALISAKAPVKAAAAPSTITPTTKPPAGGGMSAGTKYGIVAAVAGGGAVAGIAAAGGKRSR